MHSLVLALNPSIDAEWRVDDVLWEEKNNVLSERRWAGGKGVNVARWLKHLGGKPLLLVPLGGKTGDELAGYLRGEKIPSRIVRLRESTRVNVIVTTNRGRQVRFNPLGPEVSRREWRQILKFVVGLARRADRTPRRGVPTKRRNFGLLILSGSLPRGLPVTAYAQLIRLAHRCGAKTLLDCDGSAFAAAVKARPFLVKPNEHELAQWWRKPMHSERALVRAAHALSEQTRGWILVSRGAKRSLLVNHREQFECFTKPPRVKPRNTVGAGDALLAAVAQQIRLGAPPQDWLISGVSVGSLATQCSAGQLPR